MKIKGIIQEDFVNYKKPCMTIMMPICKDFKCNKECGERVCQNSELATAANIEISGDTIVKQYLHNDVTKAICFQGLEPFDSWMNLLSLIAKFRKYTMDDIVIYTGYTEEECGYWTKFLKNLFSNIIIKYGRFFPNRQPHFDEILGVNLASGNQYAKKIS